MKTTEITFEAAIAASKNEDADYAPFAILSYAGKTKVREFADKFYDGEHYNESAVFYEFEQDAEELLAGYSHVVELRRVNTGIFGGFHVDTLTMEPSDFDWMISE